MSRFFEWRRNKLVYTYLCKEDTTDEVPFALEMKLYKRSINLFKLQLISIMNQQRTDYTTIFYKKKKGMYTNIM